MRTDVKVGLVCVFAVVLAVVCYFTLHDKNHNVSTAGGPSAVAPSTPSSSGTGSLNIAAAVPTTAPSVSNTDLSNTPMLASSGGSLLGPTAAYGQVSPPMNNNMNGTVILPPGASTNPSGTSAGGLNPGSMNPNSMNPGSMSPGAPSGGGSVGLVPPGSMNTPLIPSPTLSTPGSSGPGLSTAPLSSSPGAMDGGSLLPPSAPFSSQGNNSLMTPGSVPPSPRGGARGTGVKPKHGTSTVDLTTSTPSVDILGGPTGSTGTTGTSAGGYAIQKGDTLGGLAKRNGVSVKAILAANPGVNPNRLKVGQKVNIPAAGSTPTSRPASSSRVATTRGAKGKGKASKTAGVAGGSYTVKKGDTLRKIAKATYGDESLWRRIFRANRGDMANANDLTVGEVIKLPATK